MRCPPPHPQLITDLFLLIQQEPEACFPRDGAPPLENLQLIVDLLGIILTYLIQFPKTHFIISREDCVWTGVSHK